MELSTQYTPTSTLRFSPTQSARSVRDNLARFISGVVQLTEKKLLNEPRDTYMKTI